MIQSKQEAVTILNDSSRATFDREKAIHFLKEQTLSQVEMDALVNALSDDEVGVRWAASVALAAHGRSVLPTILHALVQSNCNSLLCASVHHILHDNATSDLRVEAKELLQALKGPASDVAAMDVAFKWLQQIRSDELSTMRNRPTPTYMDETPSGESKSMEMEKV